MGLNVIFYVLVNLDSMQVSGFLFHMACGGLKPYVGAPQLLASSFLQRLFCLQFPSQAVLLLSFTQPTLLSLHLGWLSITLVDKDSA